MFFFLSPGKTFFTVTYTIAMKENHALRIMDNNIINLYCFAAGEVQKKNRIIQNYVCKTEAGLLSTDNMDQNKVIF